MILNLSMFRDVIIALIISKAVAARFGRGYGGRDARGDTAADDDREGASARITNHELAQRVGLSPSRFFPR